MKLFMQSLGYLPDLGFLGLQLWGVWGVFRFLRNPVSGIFGLLVVAGCAAVAMHTGFGIHVIPTLSGLTFGLSLAGAVHQMSEHRKNLRALLPCFSAIAVTVLAIGLWTYWLSDLDGIPSYHDGTVHSVFLHTLWTHGTFPIAQTRFALSQFFGEGFFQNYPSGSHLLASLFAFPHHFLLAPLGVPESYFFKATLIAILIGFSLWIWNWTQTLTQEALLAVREPDTLRLRIWIPLFCVGVGITYYRFPLTAVDQGGWSRLLGLLLAFSWGTRTLLLPAKDTVLEIETCLALIGSLWIHPQAFFVVGLTCGARILNLRDPRLSKEAIFKAVMYATASGFAWWVAPYTQDTQQLDSLFQQPQWGWSPFLGRMSFFLGQSIFGEPYSRAFVGISRRVLGVTGFFALLALAGPRKLTHRSFAFGPLLVLLLFCMTYFAPWSGVRLFGAPFYHQPDRMAEAFLPSLVIFWVWGMVTWSVVLPDQASRWLRFKKSNRWPKRVALGALIFSLAAQFVTGIPQVQWHIDHYGAMHRSPRFSQEGELLRKLEVKITQASASPAILIVGEPFEADLWPLRISASSSRPPVYSLFAYGECPIGGAETGLLYQGACRKRLDFWEDCRQKKGCPSLGTLTVIRASDLL